MKKLLTTLTICLTFFSVTSNAQVDKYKTAIIGKWQSVDDAGYTETFTADGKSISAYTGEKPQTLSYKVSYQKDIESNVVTKSPDEYGNSASYAIVKLDNSYMELSLIGGRGNTLKYKKVGAITANPTAPGKTLTVAAAKAFFYTNPDTKTIRKAYLLKGQKVSAGKEQNGFISATYVNDKGTKTTGWLKKSDLK